MILYATKFKRSKVAISTIPFQEELDQPKYISMRRAARAQARPKTMMPGEMIPSHSLRILKGCVRRPREVRIYSVSWSDCFHRYQEKGTLRTQEFNNKACYLQYLTFKYV
jgi:hypothetical protein